jgi:hypothetical protein
LNDDDLLTLDEATAIARYKSVKTLRRAYTRGDLAVVQPVPGGRVRVWRSELMRWLSAPRVMTRAGVHQGSPQHPTAPQPRMARTPARKAAKATAAHAGATGSAASRREPEGAPPRLSLADLSAA